MRPWFAFFPVTAFLLITTTGFTQSFQGVLRGRVVDPNGAATSGASIKLIDEATQITRTTLTNDQGEYTFASVTPGLRTGTLADDLGTETCQLPPRPAAGLETTKKGRLAGRDRYRC
jgi:protocatechuate 3,4-dioxygenase beta subunit